MYDVKDRIRGCFYAAGMGDAMGAPSEAMSREEILATYGGRITEFLDCDKNEIAKGNKAGEITDDTSQMMEMIKAIIRSEGNLTVKEAANALVEWSRNWPAYYPRNAGPTTRNVIEAIINGEDPVELGKKGGHYQVGTSNGAIMRIAGAGAIHPGDVNGAIRTGLVMTSVSHGTQIAYSAAGAIAAAIAEAMSPHSSVHSVLKAAIYGCRIGEEEGKKKARVAAGARIEPMILKAIDIAYRAKDMEEAEVMLNEQLGSDSSAIGPACAIAIGLFAASSGNVLQTILGGANVGGDTDTIACIAGSIAGAYQGYSLLPEKWVETFKKANPQLELDWAADEFTRIIEEREKK